MKGKIKFERLYLSFQKQRKKLIQICPRPLATYCLLGMVFLIGCTSYSPPSSIPTEFLARAQSQREGAIQVSAVILSAEESEQVFAAPLAKRDIQPIWLEIENGSKQELLLMLLSVDRDYFSPSEAAWKSRRFGERRSDEKMQYFYDQHIPLSLPPGITASGYVYTNFDPGVKVFAVQLLGDQKIYDFDFVLPVPGFQADFMRRNQDALYEPDEIQNLDLDGLRAYLTTLPCCALGGDRTTSGDPLNLVIVGEGRHVMVTLVRRGWDLTETISAETTLRTAISTVFGSRYRTSPVSPLYLFDRSQDAAFQKARASVDERNHLRLWRAPVNFEGTPVWVGQISRDIGVKLSGKTMVTHKIDPIVDEARTYVGLDLLVSQFLERVGFVGGVGISTKSAPKFNYTNDLYYTDGFRIVLFLIENPIAYDEIIWLDWEQPATRLKKEDPEE